MAPRWWHMRRESILQIVLVWPPTHIFLRKGIRNGRILGGVKRAPTIFFRYPRQLPRLHLGPLNGFFMLTQCPSRALDWPNDLFLKLQRIKDTVNCAALGTARSGHCPKLLLQTLIVLGFKTLLFSLSRWNLVGPGRVPLAAPPTERRPKKISFELWPYLSDLRWRRRTNCRLSWTSS